MIGPTPHEVELAGTDGGMHARLAQGLREAAHYIETHTDLPIPRDVEIHYCVPAGSDKDGEDEAYRIAAILGTAVGGDETSSEAGRSFGPAVSYRAVYLTRDRVAAYHEHMASYHAAQSAAKREARVAA